MQKTLWKLWKGRKSRLLRLGKHFRSSVYISEVEYAFYQISDITEVYTGIYRMAAVFGLIGLGVTAAVALLSVLLLRRLLRPLEELRDSAARIADGVYDQRIEAGRPDEVGELARHFNRMAEAVEQRVEELQMEARRQTLLLGALTHELKTPMTGIKGNAETLLMTRMTEEEQQEALLYIDSECTRMERLSQKMMLLISLRREGELELKTCRVEELFAQVRESSGGQMEKRGLTLEMENEMDTIEAEPDLLISLILNLIDNAGKASEPGGRILLFARNGCISVKDFGRGIPEEHLAQILQPFYMVDKSRSRRAGGVGLGLALAAEIARLHGASLTFESRVGEGTTAKVIFGKERIGKK